MFIALRVKGYMCDMMTNVSHIHEKEQAKSNTADDGYKCNSKKISHYMDTFPSFQNIFDDKYIRAITYFRTVKHNRKGMLGALTISQ